ncbi:MAG: hypothetical protein ACQEQ0_14080 [Bacteroidota bacterium]
MRPFAVVPGKNTAGAKLLVSARKYAAVDRITVTLERSSFGKKRSEMPAAKRINGSGAILNSIKNPLLFNCFIRKISVVINNNNSILLVDIGVC